MLVQILFSYVCVAFHFYGATQFARPLPSDTACLYRLAVRFSDFLSEQESA